MPFFLVIRDTTNTSMYELARRAIRVLIQLFIVLCDTTYTSMYELARRDSYGIPRDSYGFLRDSLGIPRDSFLRDS